MFFQICTNHTISECFQLHAPTNMSIDKLPTYVEKIAVFGKSVKGFN